MPRKFTPEEEKHVLKSYPAKTLSQIAEEMNCSISMVYRFLTKNNQKMRTSGALEPKDRYPQMLEFARKKGFMSTGEAISKYGYKKFAEKFEQETKTSKT